MKTVKMDLTEYMYTHEKDRILFPSLMIRRMSWIDKLLKSAGLKYSFNVIFDETEDELPTAKFTIQSFEDEKNELSLFLTNFRTVEFFGQTRCADICSGEYIIHKMVSTVSGEGMGLIFFAPSVEEYNDSLVGITPAFTLPIAVHEVELTVLESLIPALFSEHKRFLDETAAFEDIIISENKVKSSCEPAQKQDRDTTRQDEQSKEAFKPGKVYKCSLDLENIEEDAKELDIPVLSTFEDNDAFILLFEGLKKDIRKADEKIGELDQMIQERGSPFT